jgi:membrane-associated phospholipid phosphatase
VKIQTWILLGQLGATTLLDVLTDAEITPLEYEKPFVFAKAMIYTYGVTEITKGWVYRSRPDGSDGKSFFSGHASGSFAAAAFIYREISDWADAGPLRRSETGNTVLKAAAFSLCYGWATYVGYARIHDRKHYLSDVLTGAAVGTLIGNLVYDWHFSAPDNRASNLHFTFNPSSRPSIGFTYRF